MIEKKLKLCFSCNRLKHIWKNIEGKKYCKECCSIIQPKTLKKSLIQIPTFSSKRAKLTAVYTVIRKKFLLDHPMCQIHLNGCTQKATDIHHMHSGKDREQYYLDISTWKSACRNCHDWIHNHEKDAKELGFLL